MSRCHGFCSTLITKSNEGRGVRTNLIEGYKICRVCDTMILTDRKYCPCCGSNLSSRLRTADSGNKARI